MFEAASTLLFDWSYLAGNAVYLRIDDYNKVIKINRCGTVPAHSNGRTTDSSRRTPPTVPGASDPWGSTPSPTRSSHTTTALSYPQSTYSPSRWPACYHSQSQSCSCWEWIWFTAALKSAGWILLSGNQASRLKRLLFIIRTPNHKISIPDAYLAIFIMSCIIMMKTMSGVSHLYFYYTLLHCHDDNK